MFPRSSSPFNGDLSTTDEKARRVTTSMTNYPSCNALAVSTTTGQMTKVWRLLSKMKLWLPQAFSVIYCNEGTGPVWSKTITPIQAYPASHLHASKNRNSKVSKRLDEKVSQKERQIHKRLQLELKIKQNFIDFSFLLLPPTEQQPWTQILHNPRSISKRHGREHNQTENKGTSLDCEAFSGALPPPLNLFVRRRCSSFLKHCRLSLSDAQKATEWRGTYGEGQGWLWRRCVTTHTHKLSPSNLSISLCQQTLSITPLSPNQSSFLSRVKSRGGNLPHRLHLIQTELQWRWVKGSNGATIKNVLQDKWALQLHSLLVQAGCVYGFGLIRTLGWTEEKLVPTSNDAYSS